MVNPLFYIHDSNLVWPHKLGEDGSIGDASWEKQERLSAVTPLFTGIPPGAMRRMSQSVKLGLGAVLPLLQEVSTVSGIIMGTANAGMQDCFQFLKQIVEYDEGLLTPGSFVQSTPNALAGQLAMLSSNHAYNATHVHLGLAFENAALDAVMLIRENPENNYLLGAVDDISQNNHALNELAGWHKKAPISAAQFYEADSAGSVAGEGAVMFLVNGKAEGATAALKAIHTIHSEKKEVIAEELLHFLASNLPAGETIDLFISGENGDSRLLPFYTSCKEVLPLNTTVARFKHLSGEYPTVTSIALWLACYVLRGLPVPTHLLENGQSFGPIKNILVYNTHKGFQHSLMLVSKP